MLKENGENGSSAPVSRSQSQSHSRSQKGTVAIPMEMFEQFEKLSSGFHQSPENVVQRFKQMLERDLEEDGDNERGDKGKR